MSAASWRRSLALLLAVWAAIFAFTAPAWRAMFHQWWDIDTYQHLQLVPFLLVWLAWLKRDEIVQIAPRGWWPGLLALAAGCGLFAAGMAADINTLAEGGAVLALQGAVVAVFGLRAALLLAFPIAFAFALVPLGGEIIPPLQILTARMVTVMTELSGVSTLADGIHIRTPAGLFNVAEECAGVKFLIATVTWGLIVCYAAIFRWRPRVLFMLACVIVPIIGNAIRAWATIYAAQYVGAEAATGFDHLIYGWVFFAIILAIMFLLARPWMDGYPREAGWHLADIAAWPIVERAERLSGSALTIAAAALGIVAAFALALRLL